MRRVIDQGQATVAARANFIDRLFEIVGRELVYGQSLFFRAIRIAAVDADGEFSRRQPVTRLAPVLRYDEFGFGQEAAEKIGAELRIVVKPHHARRTGARPFEKEDFSFPLGLKQIPVGFEFLDVHQTGIVMKSHSGDAPLVHENELFFGVRVGMLAVEPL